MPAAAQPKAASATGFFITVVTPKGQTTKKIEGDKLSVGRASECDLSIPHETLSRRHMTVQLRNNQCWVEDHGSSNGTFVNGKRISAHTPTRVVPEDHIQLGQSGVRISVSIEQQMWKGETPPIPEESKGEKVDTIVTSTINERKLKAIEIAPEPKRSDEATEQAEKMVQEAQKKSATLIQEAEIEAERRVQDIYRRAHETQAKMDEIYQKRLNEAYRAAEKIYQKSQSESELILDQARSKSSEIRSQAESFVMELRSRTEEDCERILQEAQATARELKESRLAEADEIIKKKEEELVNSSRESLDIRLARFEDDLAKETAKQREQLEIELRERRKQLDVEHKEQIEMVKSLKVEVKHLTEVRDKESAKVKELQGATEKLATIKSEVDAYNATILQLRQEIEGLNKGRADGKAALDKIKSTQKSMDEELLKLRSKFEEDRVKIQKTEQKHLDELKLSTAQRVQAMEQKLMEELKEKRERLSREISLKVEALVKGSGGKNSGHKNAADEIQKLINSELVTLSSDPSAKIKHASMVSLKRREKFKTAMLGFIIGIVSWVSGQRGYYYFKYQQAPLKSKIQQAADERKQDLEKRKFNPEQTHELKDSYVDAVIYTEGFSKTYVGDEYQRKLLIAVAPYMLKMWRVDEDKVIQVIAISTTLVKGLAEKKDAIHPDFVPQGLEKMKELEAEALTRMRQILGNQVRLDSFRKYERKVYNEL